MEKKVECTIPVLPVKNLKDSIKFYVETLGFTVDWEGQFFASVSRDGCPIMLNEKHDSTDQAWAWIGLADDTIFDEYKGKGVNVFQEPQNHPWAYEMKFEDIDGNILWLGTEPRKDMPQI